MAKKMKQNSSASKAKPGKKAKTLGRITRRKAKAAPSPKKKNDGLGLKLRRLQIKNYKAFDSLDLSIPEPKMPGDPDMLVIGSKNGVGKTSILEAASLLLLGALAPNSELFSRDVRRAAELPLESMIRAGAEKALLEGEFDYDGSSHRVAINISMRSGIKIQVRSESLVRVLRRQDYSGDIIEPASKIPYLFGLSTEPLIAPPLLYFHSYRKVAEGDPELRQLTDQGDFFSGRIRRMPPHRMREYAPSIFKLEVLRAIMSRADLFEDISHSRSDIALDKANELMRRFAGGELKKLRPSPDNTIEFRVYPTAGGEPFSFDGLSSGQKEIISTLFLIWRHSYLRPSLVLIDEPELHLNAEWHRDFVKTLCEIAPENQYLIATHSEDVFGSVDSDRRLMLLDSGSNQ